MFKTLEIQNFQSHENTRLELHPGINAIVGDSDKGKSATLRALLWAATNRPSGDAHVSDWCRTKTGGLKKGTGARVTVTDATGACARVRTGDVNGYEVNGVLCEAVRTDVPDEAQDFFNLGEVNIQRQTDPPFLLASSAGEVARFFNRIIKLEEIDKTLSMAESRRRATTAETKILDADIIVAEKALADLHWVDVFSELAARAEIQEAEIVEATKRLAGLRIALDEWQKAALVVERLAVLENARGYVSKAFKTQQATKESARVVVTLGAELPRWQEAAQQARQVRDTALKGPDVLRRLREALTGVQNATAAKVALERAVREYENAKPKPGVAEALQQAKISLVRVTALERKIANKTQSVDSVSRALIEHQLEQERTYDVRSELKGLVAALPPTCPTCGQAWNHKHGQ